MTAELHDRKLLAKDQMIRLPSEAEWEYCCRAGTTTRYSFGDKAADLGDYACTRTTRPATIRPSAPRSESVGLYDMHGYVREWCADAWHRITRAPRPTAVRVR